MAHRGRGIRAPTPYRYAASPKDLGLSDDVRHLTVQIATNSTPVLDFDQQHERQVS